MPLDAGELKLEVVDDAHATIIRFPPQTALVEANAEAFSQQLNTLAAQRQPPHLVIDLANVSLLTSVILAKLITLNAKIRAAGGHLELIHAAPAIYEVFHITRLDTILDVQAASH